MDTQPPGPPPLLDTLFGDPAGFRAAYPSRPFVAHGALDRFPAFLRELTLGWLTERYRDGLDLHGRDSRPVTIRGADREAIDWLLERTAGITFERVERYVPGLDAWCAELAEQLGLPPYALRPRCNAFASPASDGYPFHFHYEGALLVQLEGRKSARVAPMPGGVPVVQTDSNQRFEDGYGTELRPMEAFAQFAATGFPSPPAESAEYVLSPGSVLFLPPGCWHATRSLDPRSFAVSFFVGTPRLHQVMLRALELALVTDPAWREPVDPRTVSPEALLAARDALARRVATLRLEDLQACAGMQPPLSDGSTLCPNPDARWAFDGRDQLTVRTDADYRIEVEPSLGDACRDLLQRTTAFRLGEASAGTDPDDVVQAARLLESVGALVRGPFPLTDA